MLVALAGPTAAGKSALGLLLAQTLDAEIICADSRQIYKHLDIGTAKPTPEERHAVPHQLFDIADPCETFTVAQYCEAASACIAEVSARGRVPILVGGTGLYFRTLLYDYSIPEVPPQAELRRELEAEDRSDPGCLYRRLQAKDPPSALKLHPNDLRRIVRALEVEAITGRPISAWQSRSQQLRRPCRYLALTSPQDVLWRRIRQRIDAMFAAGLLAELEGLRARYGRDLPLLQTLNYAESGQHLDGILSLEAAKEAMFIHTRQYAKRQLTWFRRDTEIEWHSVSEAQDISRLAEQLARELGARQEQVI
ncbi:MAG TPA: tRNA (adenosine(37)-N6)-dimethylallyltransferase MiaA [Candidatus Obscuribacterales bacterium]